MSMKLVRVSDWSVTLHAPGRDPEVVTLMATTAEEAATEAAKWCSWATHARVTPVPEPVGEAFLILREKDGCVESQVPPALKIGKATASSSGLFLGSE